MSLVDKNVDVVLVVDDLVEIFFMLSQVLDDVGLIVLIVLDGEQVLNIVKKMVSDIILMDVMMLIMDGFEICWRMKQEFIIKNILIIFMIGLSDMEYIVMGLEVGGVDYIIKLINLMELLVCMWVYLSNVCMILSVWVVLDIVGQNIFIMDNDGCMLWGMLQVFVLFEFGLVEIGWLDLVMVLML